MNGIGHLSARGASLVLFAVAASTANAATYDFGSLLSGPGAPSSLSFATLSTAVVGNDVHFTLNAFGLNLFAGSEPFVGSMAVDGTKTGSVSGVSGGVGSVDISSGGGPGGGWEFRFGFGGGADKLVDNESVSWTWVGGKNNYTDFALHVQGISYASGATTSAWYVSAVPEPEAYAMALSALGLLGFFRRLRRSKA